MTTPGLHSTVYDGAMDHGFHLKPKCNIWEAKKNRARKLTHKVYIFVYSRLADETSCFSMMRKNEGGILRWAGNENFLNSSRHFYLEIIVDKMRFCFLCID